MILQAVPSGFQFHKVKMVGRLWLGVKVIACSSMLFGLKIVSFSEKETFRIVISRLEEEKFSERRLHKVSIQDNNHRHEVQLDIPLSFCSREAFNCRSKVFHLADSYLFLFYQQPSTINFSDRASSNNKTSSRSALTYAIQ